MSATLFDGYLPIDRYDRSELCNQFASLANATGGKFSPAALNWYFAGSNAVVHNIFWHGFPACLWIEHDWTVHTNLEISLPPGHCYELRFNNVYGSASGVPIIGRSRVESDLLSPALVLLLPEQSYWRMALAHEPFALTLSKERLTLASYRFYPHEFYLGALDYLTDMAMRLDSLVKARPPVKPAVTRAELPWIN